MYVTHRDKVEKLNLKEGVYVLKVIYYNKKLGEYLRKIYSMVLQNLI